jgi:4'-phosphopantetheinyl transferase
MELPPPGAVDVIVVHDASQCPSALAVTEAEERLAARRITNERALRWRTARALMRLVASKYLGCEPLEVPITLAACVHCGEPHGKPVLADSPVHINLSHTQNTVVIGIASSPVGVDVEPGPSGRDWLKLSTRFYSTGEADWVREAGPVEAGHRFLRLWVRKEAILKATGEGLPGGLETVRVLGPAPLTLTRSVAGVASPWTVADVDAATHPFAAVALAGEECRPRVLGLAHLDGPGSDRPTARRPASASRSRPRH